MYLEVKILSKKKRIGKILFAEIFSLYKVANSNTWMIYDGKSVRKFTSNEFDFKAKEARFKKNPKFIIYSFKHFTFVF